MGCDQSKPQAKQPFAKPHVPPYPTGGTAMSFRTEPLNPSELLQYIASMVVLQRHTCGTEEHPIHVEVKKEIQK